MAVELINLNAVTDGVNITTAAQLGLSAATYAISNVAGSMLSDATKGLNATYPIGIQITPTGSGTDFLQRSNFSTPALALTAPITIDSAPNAELFLVWHGVGTSRKASISLAGTSFRRLIIRDALAVKFTGTVDVPLGDAVAYMLWTGPESVDGAGDGQIGYAAFNLTTGAYIYAPTVINGCTTAVNKTAWRVGKAATGAQTNGLSLRGYVYQDIGTPTGVIGLPSAPPAVAATVSGQVVLVSALSSTYPAGHPVTYSISQTSGPTTAATPVIAGVWQIPQNADSALGYNVTITDTATGLSSTVSKTVPRLPTPPGLSEILVKNASGVWE